MIGPFADTIPDMGTKRGDPAKFIEKAILVDQDECLIWPFSRGGTTGYGRTYLPDGEDSQGRLLFKETDVHRIICQRVYGDPPTPNHESAHSCGNGHLGCINRKHLRWATGSENQNDRLLHGTDGRGEKNPFAKLSRSDILTIRSLEGRVPRKELAKRFCINPWYVRNIQKRRTWKWL